MKRGKETILRDLDQQDLRNWFAGNANFSTEDGDEDGRGDYLERRSKENEICLLL